ncbi:MAG: DUF4185 domain-containing protein [Isosphaeraceae bacterium]
MTRTDLLAISLFTLLCVSESPRAAWGESEPKPNGYFAIEVIDDQTGRGVPMVELRTTNSVSYMTDSAGLVAFDEPGLMGKNVFFSVSSHGYECPRDGFGIRGVVLETKQGASAKIKIKRINIAERLYRITGQGIYRDSVLLGRKVPIADPLLNAQVMGQDGTLNALYRGKLYWFYGDTNRLSYALGNFSMSGATTDAPDKIDPAVGFNLKYFVGKDGFVRAMAPMKGDGVVWLFGLVVLPSEKGGERMFAFFQRRQGLGAVLENGFVIYDDATQSFKKLKTLPLDPPIFPQGYPFVAKTGDGVPYLYFTAPYPALRVKADEPSYLNPTAYEGYTCLKPGTRYVAKDKAQLERNDRGNLVWSWKKDTPPLNPNQQNELIAQCKMKREESPLRLQNVEDGKQILLNNCSCNWNEYRKKYVMIASESMGATMLGEVWYAEADHPEGPWINARKIITHADKKDDPHDFYNPVHHPFFDREGGRVIYLEGSYVNTFSGNPHPTPYYEYNQIMYRLDLADPRLSFKAGSEDKPR